MCITSVNLRFYYREIVNVIAEKPWVYVLIEDRDAWILTVMIRYGAAENDMSVKLLEAEVNKLKTEPDYIDRLVNDINKNLKKIVMNFGINSAQFDKCLIDETISDKILNGRIDANHKYSIDSTPTIIINEKKLQGSASFKNIKKKIEKLI